MFPSSESFLGGVVNQAPNPHSFIRAIKDFTGNLANIARQLHSLNFTIHDKEVPIPPYTIPEILPFSFNEYSSVEYI